jgi:small GTP-binding protein
MNIGNYTIKVVLTGNTSVGKTCLIHRLIQFQYVEGFHQTIATSTHDWTANVGNRTIDIKIWDTAGQERYRTLAPVYFRDAAAAIVVFDATESDVIPELREWIQTFKENARMGAVVVLAANKADLVEDRVALQEKLNKVKEEFQAECFPTSAKTGENVAQIFQFAAEQIVKAFPTDILMASELHESEGDFCSC